MLGAVVRAYWGPGASRRRRCKCNPNNPAQTGDKLNLLRAPSHEISASGTTHYEMDWEHQSINFMGHACLIAE